MKRRTTGKRAVALAMVFGALALAGAIGVKAQGGGGGGRPMVPIAASSLARNPDGHYGETVSMTATVEQLLSKTAFSVDQDRTKNTGQEILVLAPTLNAAPEVNGYITVFGEVVKLDAAEIAKKARNYKIDLAPEVLAKFAGKPVVLATAVVDSKMTDLAKRVLPPLTPEEIAFDKVMKTVSATFTSLRGETDGTKVDAFRQDADTLRKAFVETEAFFKGRSAADAVGWAQEAQKLVESMERSAATSKWEEVRTTVGTLNQMCATCHGVHRERIEDGTYRVRPSGGRP